MCIVFISTGYHHGYKLILLNNRDEVLERPTQKASFWESDDGNIIAGKDLLGLGTWLGITKKGRWGVLTNITIKELYTDSPSRGELVTNFLRSNDDPLDYLIKLKNSQKKYNGFNLLLGIKNDRIACYSNLDIKSEPLLLCKDEIYGLSNHLIDYPWYKITRGKKLLRNIDPSKFDNTDSFIKSLFDILNDKVNVEQQQKNIKERKDNQDSIFLEPFKLPDGYMYGTRSCTVILIDDKDNVYFCEKSLNFENGKWETQRINFKIE